MEIKTIGYAKVKAKPDIVTFHFQFEQTADKYNEAVSLGLKQVKETLNVLSKLGFKQEDMKTEQFLINKNKHYNDALDEKVNYTFYQDSELTFPISNELMVKVMKGISEIDGPDYYVNASLSKNTNDQFLFEKAFISAKEKANILARLNNKSIVECCDIIEVDNGLVESVTFKTESIFQSFFSPNDIILEKQIKVEWKAESL